MPRLFKKIISRARSTRGDLDTAETWNLMINDGHYEEVLAQYNALSSEDQQTAKGMLNEIQEDFGDLFYTNKQSAEMGWAESDPEQQDKIANFI